MNPLRIPRILSALMAALLTAPAGGQVPRANFAPAVSYDPGPGSMSVAVADLRSNGKLDLVVANYCKSYNQSGNCIDNAEGGVGVLMGNGDGTFQAAVAYGTGAPFATSVAVGDVNGDGIPDLVVSDWCRYGDCSPANGAVSVLLGNGDGTFQPPVLYGSGGYEAYSVALADLRNNGQVDVIVTNTYYDKTFFHGGVSVLLGNGDGTFQAAVGYDSGGRIATSVAVGDVNGDGIPDLVVDNYNGSGGPNSTVSVLFGNGDGTFRPAVVYDSGGEYADSVALGDLRGNGIPDVVVANRWSDGWGGWQHSDVGALLGNGDGTFQQAVTYPVGGVSGAPFPAIGAGYNALVVTDLNGDRVPDVAVVRWCTRMVHYEDCSGDKDVSVLLGNGDGTFQKASVYNSGGLYGAALAVADVNGDGRPDLIVANNCSSSCNGQTGSVAVLLNETSYTSKTALAASPNPAHVNQLVTFTATIMPGVPNGEVVAFYNGKATLGTGKTTNGVATLTTSFPKAGKYTIKAAYPGDAFRKASSGTVKQVVSP